MNDFDVLTLKDLGKARVNRLARVSRDNAVETATTVKTKVIFVHGFWKGPGEYRRLIQLLMDTSRGSGDVFVYHFRSFRGDAEATARGLAGEITRLLECDPDGQLVLVGHSLGGALARRAILLLIAGFENESGGPGQAMRTDLYARVDRLILLSSTNRGFEPKSLWQGLARRVVEIADWRSPILDVLRGSKWISDLRLEWIEMFGGVKINPEPPIDPEAEYGVVIPKSEGSNVPAHPKTIQIDGARDRVVRPDDSADMALFASSVRQFVVRGIVHLDFALKGLSERAQPVEAGKRTSVSEIDVGALEPPELVSLDEPERDHERQLAELAGLISDAVGGKLDPPPGKKPGPGFGLRQPESLGGYDLRLMSWGDGSGVPTSGNNLAIVGTDNNGLLHIRIFDACGNRVTDTDETKLPSTQAAAISTLKQQLPALLPPHVLTGAEKSQVLTEVTSIVGHTPPGSGAPRPKLPACPPGGWWAGGLGGPPTYDIVFMIHGIRDYGSWHPILGEALEREVRRATGYWKIVPIEYGYFSALQFLIPIQQRRLVKGFSDRYLNELTRALRAMIQLGVFTQVRLHAATHSNGCNLLAQAITGNDRITFARVFQAGCVLPRDFWARDRNDKAAFAVRNDCATLDWPVGVLCGHLGRIPLPAFSFLGPAGVLGFEGPVVINAPAPPGPKRRFVRKILSFVKRPRKSPPRKGSTRRFVRNNMSFVGDHGAALEPARMASIARYLVSSNLSAPVLDAQGPDPMRGPRFALWIGLIVVAGSFGCLLVSLGLVGGLAAAGLGLAAVVATAFVIAVLLNF